MSRLIFNQLSTTPSDTDAGSSQLYLKDDGKLYIKNASNTEVALLTGTGAMPTVASGKVGIGTNSPDYTLDVAGNIGVDQYIYHNGDEDTHINFTNNDLAMYAGGAGIYIASGDGSGKVGIGTTTPQGLLHIKHATNSTQLSANHIFGLSTGGISISAVPIAKAWVNFNGESTVAITKSYNVSSLTDNGTGDYTINFATDFSDANYCVIGGAHRKSGDGSMRMFGTYDATSMAVGSCRINSQYSGGNSSDSNRVQVVFFSD